MCQRYKLIVQYIGTNYHGITGDIKGTVNYDLMKSLKSLYGENNVGELACSSRTDSGVHAYANCFHVDVTRKHKKTGLNIEPYDPNILKIALNYKLKDSEISILKVESVPLTFHSRHSVVDRSYIYKILCNCGNIHPINHHFLFNEKERIWCIREDLSVKRMQEASNYLIGYHDFSSYRGITNEKQNPWRNVKNIKIKEIKKYNNHLIYNNSKRIDIYITAKSFVYHMVRDIVGMLYLVGSFQRSTYFAKYVLDQCNNALFSERAPPYGLYLANVRYPEDPPFDYDFFQLDSYYLL